MLVYLVGSLGEQGFKAVAATTIRANVANMVRDRINAMDLGAKFRTAAAAELTRLAASLDAEGTGRVIQLTKYWDGPALAELGTIENGVQWLQRDGVAPGTTISTRYWVRDHNAGAKTFKLSTNSGLSDVVNLTSSGSQGDSTRIYARLTAPYSDTWMSGDGSSSSHKYEIYSASRYANALGFTLPSGFLAAMDAYMVLNKPADAQLMNSIGNHFNATF